MRRVHKKESYGVRRWWFGFVDLARTEFARAQRSPPVGRGGTTSGADDTPVGAGDHHRCRSRASEATDCYWVLSGVAICRGPVVKKLSIALAARVLNVDEHRGPVGGNVHPGDLTTGGTGQEAAQLVCRRVTTDNRLLAARHDFAAVTDLACDRGQHLIVGEISKAAVVGLNPDHAAGGAAVEPESVRTRKRVGFVEVGQVFGSVAGGGAKLRAIAETVSAVKLDAFNDANRIIWRVLKAACVVIADSNDALVGVIGALRDVGALHTGAEKAKAHRTITFDTTSLQRGIVKQVVLTLIIDACRASKAGIYITVLVQANTCLVTNSYVGDGRIAL